MFDITYAEKIIESLNKYCDEHECFSSCRLVSFPGGCGGPNFDMSVEYLHKKHEIITEDEKELEKPGPEPIPESKPESSLPLLPPYLIK